MAKIILNKGYGGFSVSPLAHKIYAERIGKELFYYVGNYDHYNHGLIYTKVSFEEFKKQLNLFYFYSTKDLGDSFVSDIIRDIGEEYELDLDENHREDPLLIEIVEELGKEASGRFGTLEVVEIPDELANGNHMIDDYDGIETLHAKVEVY